MTYRKRRLLGRFVLNILKLRNFLKTRLRQSNGRCSWVCYTKQPGCLRVSVRTVWVYYISAWASALLVLLSWAMRRPQSVGRVTGTDSRAFFVLIGMAESGESIGCINIDFYEKGLCGTLSACNSLGRIRPVALYGMRHLFFGTCRLQTCSHWSSANEQCSERFGEVIFKTTINK